jgi:lambda family phage holin
MQEKYIGVIDWLEMYGWLITGAILAFATALVRTAKDKEADILEALFCALITLGLSSLLMWLHMPLILSMFIGAFIGGLGSKWAQAKMIAQAESRLSDKYDDLKKQIEVIKNEPTSMD